MMHTSRLALVLTLTLTLVASAARPHAEGRDAAAVDRDAPAVPGIDEDVVATLRPTNHARVPADLSQLWLAPEPAHRPRNPALEPLATAVKLEVDGNYARALPLLARPALHEGTLGAYALYYKGLAELRLGSAAEARATFRKLADRRPVGFLAEAAALREAEADEMLGAPAAAVAIYEVLAAGKTTAPDEVLMKLGRAARAAGSSEKALGAFARLYYDYPLSDLSVIAGTEMKMVPGEVAPLAPGTERFARELQRAERLFGARRYTEARIAFETLRSLAPAEDRELPTLRLAESELYLKHPRTTRDLLRPLVEKASRQAEVLYFYGVAAKDLGDDVAYTNTIRRVIADFPTDSWAEEALNNLATRLIVLNENEKADDTFRELVEKFPAGKYAERASWKLGWWAYKNGRYEETARLFERAAANFPRSDYRPPWLYWAGRANELLDRQDAAQQRYQLAATDYLNSYYGRLAVARLTGSAPDRRLVVARTPAPARATPQPSEPSDEPFPASRVPPNHDVIRALLELKLYDQALDELRYAQKVWGDAPPIQATIAWVYEQQGQQETGQRQFALFRGAITNMRRAYPQFLAAGGEQLPPELLRVIFPLHYWELIRKHADERNLDPYLVAALMAQESTFVKDIKSSANAVGLMQLMPATARQYARVLKLPYSPTLLTSPDANIRLGTTFLAEKMREFKEVHLVLASYNAGEGAVRRWVNDRSALTRDEFIEDIPYPETQNYVKRIIGTAEDYRRLYGGAGTLKPEALAVAVPVVSPPSSSRKPQPSAVRKKSRTKATNRVSRTSRKAA